MIKLIASDCDGTLLNSNKEISIDTKKLIIEYVKQGNYFTLCSGRPFYRVEKYLKELNLNVNNQYYIGFNGALICNGDGSSIIESKTLSNKEASYIIKIAKQNKVCVSVYTYDTVYTEKVSKYIEKENIYKGVNVVFVNDLLSLNIEQPIYKVLFADHPDIIKNARKMLKSEDFINYSIVSSGHHFLEFMNKDTSKGAAFEVLASYLNVNLSDTLALGDAENDLSMFKVTPNSVAMENSSQEIKEKCKFITSSNDNEGVANILNKVFKGGI